MTSTDPTVTDETEDQDLPPFSGWLMDHRFGQLNQELTAAFAELIEAVETQAKGGSLTLTIKVSHNGQNQLLVKDSIASKLPTPPPPETFYFADGHGGLSRRDPRQPQLPNID